MLNCIKNTCLHGKSCKLLNNVHEVCFEIYKSMNTNFFLKENHANSLEDTFTSQIHKVYAISIRKSAITKQNFVFEEVLFARKANFHPT